MEERLLKEARLGEVVESLFAEQWTDEERRQALIEAYRFMNRRKAYRQAAQPEDGGPST
jgi:hypothetical protein